MFLQNDKGQIPADVVPDPVDMPLEMADAAASAKEIKQILLDAVPLSCDISKAMIPSYDHVTGRAMLLSLGLKLGDRVVIAGQKVWPPTWYYSHHSWRVHLFTTLEMYLSLRVWNAFWKV